MVTAIPGGDIAKQKDLLTFNESITSAFASIAAKTTF